MKSIVMIMVLISYNGSYDIGQDLINYCSNITEQVVNYQVESKDNIKESISAFVELLNKYILRNNIGIMNEDNYIDFSNTFS